VLLAVVACARPAHAEDGYDLWLRYRPLSGESAQAYRASTTRLIAPATSPTQIAARHELLHALTGLLGNAPPTADAVDGDGALVVGTAASSPLIARLKLDTAKIGREGYLIRSVVIG